MKILVALDGSTLSWKAFKTTLTIAKALGEPTEIHVIHVTCLPILQPLRIPYNVTVAAGVPPALASVIPDSVREKDLRTILELMEKARMEAESYGFKIDFIIRRGDPKKEIVREASRGYDMLVLGGRSEVSAIPGLGSVASAIVEKTPCSILVVK